MPELVIVHSGTRAIEYGILSSSPLSSRSLWRRDSLCGFSKLALLLPFARAAAS
jgi:hypothetical protein